MWRLSCICDDICGDCLVHMMIYVGFFNICGVSLIHVMIYVEFVWYV